MRKLRERKKAYLLGELPMTNEKVGFELIQFFRGDPNMPMLLDKDGHSYVPYSPEYIVKATRSYDRLLEENNRYREERDRLAMFLEDATKQYHYAQPIDHHPGEVDECPHTICKTWISALKTSTPPTSGEGKGGGK